MSEDERFTFSNSENQSLESLNFGGIYDSSNFVEVCRVSLTRSLVKKLLLLSTLDVAWLATKLLESLLNIWEHLPGCFHNLEGVHEIGEGLFGFLELGTLSLNESLLLSNFSLDLFE